MLDRWARNVGVQRQALQRLGDAKVSFASATEDFDFTSPDGRLFLTMIGGVAEFFSDKRGVHVSKSQRQRAELNAWCEIFDVTNPIGRRTPMVVCQVAH